MRAAAAALCLAALFAAGVASAQDRPRTLTVQGAGEAFAAPDRASAEFGVSVRAATAEAAAAEAARRARAVIEALRGQGVAERALRTLEIGLSPVYARSERDEPPRLEGYEARHRLSARLDALDRLGAAIDAAVAAGATDIGGVVFDISDRDRLLREARRAAVTDAAAAARLLADAAGVRLGALVSMSVGGGPGPWPAAPMRADAIAAATPVAAGEISVSASVTAVYALE